MRNLSTHGFTVLSVALAIIVVLNIFSFLADQAYRQDQIRSNQETKEARIAATNDRVSLKNLLVATNERSANVENYIVAVLHFMNDSQSRSAQILPDWNNTLHDIRDEQGNINQKLDTILNNTMR